MEVETLGTIRLDNEDGESFTRLTVLEFPAGTCDLVVHRHVADQYPAQRCQHEHDCCGHFYPRAAHWTRLTPLSCRVVVSQAFAANI